MRTNVDIDDKLLAKVMKKAGAKTKREALHVAMREYVTEAPDYSAILKLFGAGIMDPDYDPKNPAGDLPRRRAA